MKLSWQIVRLDLKETFSISYGNYSFREALIITLTAYNTKGFGECTAIDYYQIDLNEFSSKLLQIQEKIQAQKIVFPSEFYAFLVSLHLPPFLQSALDCAYWDLFGKLEKKSFLELNAISVLQLPESSFTISVDTIENQIKKIKTSAWKQFKVKCKNFDLKRFRSLVELDEPIALDSNGSFEKEMCIWLQNEVESEKFLYIEQPMKKGKENYEILKKKLHSHWMADEDCLDTNSLELLQNHYKSINIKLVKCGGLTPALTMIKKARSLQYKIMIGCMTESTIGISAAAVVAPLCDFADLDGANLLSNDFAKGSNVVNGKIQICGQPGLGIQLV